jgi:hypothetical protein
MSIKDENECEGEGKKIDFELSPADLKAIASGKSVQIPSSKFFGKTAFTIENAPIPKSIHDNVTIQLHIGKGDKE